MGAMGRRRLQALGALVAAGLVVAACGQNGKKPQTGLQPPGTDTVSTAAEVTESTTTSSPADEITGTTTGTGLPGTTTRSTASSKRSKPASGGATTTTAKPKSQVQITAAPSSAPAEPPQSGGTLTVLMPTEGNGFDPTKGTGSATTGDMQRMFAVYDALVYQDPTTANVVPELAASMTSPDARVWTMKLHPGVKFTDGTAYDADAVKFNWDRHADPVNSSPWAATLKTLNYQVLDPLTMQITLTKANSQFPRVISRQLSYIASPTAIDAAGSEQAYNTTKPVGAGPFMLLTWVRDNQTVFVRNPNYWNSPRPYLDSLVMRVVTDETQRSGAMKSGAADMALTSNALSAQDIVSNKTLGLQLYSSPPVSTYGFGMNESHPPFNDKNVRRAMQLAVDVDQYNKVVNNNVLESPRQMFPSNYPYADPTLVYPAPDLTQAQKLIDAAVAANNNTDIQFTYTYVTGSATADAAAGNLQRQIERLNHVKVTLRGESLNQYVADLVQKNFDANTINYVGVDPESDWTEAVITNGSRNFYGYSSAAVDSAVADSRTTVDADARIRDLKTAQKAVMDDMLFFPLNRAGLFFVFKATVRDVATFDDGGLLSDRAWIKTRG